MFHFIAGLTALSLAHVVTPAPRQPAIYAFTFPGAVAYYSRNAHTVALNGAEVPPWGVLRLPPGVYTLTAHGDRGLTESVQVVIP